MKRTLSILILGISAAAAAQNTTSPAARVGEDARAIQRVAEASRRDFPASVVQRIAEEDLDLLRGKQSDGTYRYAHYERQEGGRVSDRFAIHSASEDALDKIEFAGERAYRLIVSVPNRRLLVARNRRVFIDRVELDYSPFGGTRQTSTVDVKKWISVGEQTTVDFPDIARRARAKVHGRVDAADGGAATVELTLLQARLVDNSDSPYAASVATVAALARAAEHDDLGGVKTYSADLASRLASNVATMPCVDTAAATPQRPLETTISVTPETMPQVEVYMELQNIEDMLTGTEGERRDAVDKLHQLIRKLRPGAR